MSNFDAQYGEGTTQDLLNTFEITTQNVPEITVDVPEQHGGQMVLRFEDGSVCSICYRPSYWNFVALSSNGSGLLDELVSVLPAFASGLGVGAFRAGVYTPAMVRVFQGVGFEGESFGEGKPPLEMPLDKGMEYGEWIRNGKRPEAEPVWRQEWREALDG